MPNSSLYIFLPLLLFLACDSSEPSPSSPFEITVAGDSRVEGGPIEDFHSFRYDLWKKLVDRNVDFDFLGSRNDNKSYDQYLGLEFDNDHEGKLGDRSDQLLSRINTLITSQPAQIGNVVIVSVGGNDLFQGILASEILSNLGAIIDKLQEHNDSITIFVEQIEDGTSSFNSTEVFDPIQLDELNSGVMDFEAEKSTEKSRVVAVNMVSLLEDSDYADDLHYNIGGAEKIAEQYFQAFDRVLF